jgi:hypothetical protein
MLILAIRKNLIRSDQHQHPSVLNREQKDMAKHNGHLTKTEQKGINRQQNRISKTIYKDKHKQ